MSPVADSRSPACLARPLFSESADSFHPILAKIALGVATSVPIFVAEHVLDAVA